MAEPQTTGPHTTGPQAAPARPNPPKRQNRAGLTDILWTVLIPSIIMMSMASEDRLGPAWALVVALAFPVTHGVRGVMREGRVHWLSILGIVSVLLTGGLALLELPKEYIVVKETGIPLLIGLVLLGFQLAGKPLVRWVLSQVMDMEKVAADYAALGKEREFRRDVAVFDYGYLVSFFISAVLNYLLAVFILQSDPGTPAFTEELGQMTALSFPVISVPLMIITLGLLIFLWWRISKVTGNSAEHYLLLQSEEATKAPASKTRDDGDPSRGG